MTKERSKVPTPEVAIFGRRGKQIRRRLSNKCSTIGSRDSIDRNALRYRISALLSQCLSMFTVKQLLAIDISMTIVRSKVPTEDAGGVNRRGKHTRRWSQLNSRSNRSSFAIFTAIANGLYTVGSSLSSIVGYNQILMQKRIQRWPSNTLGDALLGLVTVGGVLLPGLVTVASVTSPSCLLASR